MFENMLCVCINAQGILSEHAMSMSVSVERELQLNSVGGETRERPLCFPTYLSTVARVRIERRVSHVGRLVIVLLWRAACK
jgi:hypothetical protein